MGVAVDNAGYKEIKFESFLQGHIPENTQIDPENPEKTLEEQSFERFRSNHRKYN